MKEVKPGVSADEQMVTQRPLESWYAFIARATKHFRRIAVLTPAEDHQARLQLLKAFAEVKVANWGHKTPRSYWKRRQRVRGRKAWGPPEPCFVCERETRLRHHVIQVQHGGGQRRNKVPICDGCHADVHPWLKGKSA